MGVCYYGMGESSYILKLENGPLNIMTNNYISECCDPTCVYFRGKTNIRERFEKKIVELAFDKDNIKILFYGSYFLYQELQILHLIGHKISEIHLTDYAYENFMDNNDLILCFEQFLSYIKENKLNIRVYVHSDPNKLKNSIYFKRRFDIVCGIDIDYILGNNDNRPIIKEISRNTLRIDGTMCVSQNCLDQVDLSCYGIMDNGDISLNITTDFVKEPYYYKYILINIYSKLYYPFSFDYPFSFRNPFSSYYPVNLLGLAISFKKFKYYPTTSVILGTCCIFGIGKYFLIDDFIVKIRPYNDLSKNN